MAIPDYEVFHIPALRYIGQDMDTYKKVLMNGTGQAVTPSSGTGLATMAHRNTEKETRLNCL